MVAYDFKCKKCGKQFEITCHMDERKDKAVCPKCGSHKVKQKLTAAFSSPPPAKYWVMAALPSLVVTTVLT